MKAKIPHHDFTREQYEAHASEYLESNLDGTIGGETPQQRVALLTRFLKPKSRVFEIGSGGGLDADALTAAGYIVTPTDAVQPFVEKLTAKGYDAHIFDAKFDQLIENYDALYANAVFVHFSAEEIMHFLSKTKTHLKNDKLVFATVLKGTGSERSARGRSFERDFYYYQLSQLEEVFILAGYEILLSEEIDGKWIRLVAKARAELASN